MCHYLPYSANVQLVHTLITLRQATVILSGSIWYLSGKMYQNKSLIIFNPYTALQLGLRRGAQNPQTPTQSTICTTLASII